MNDNKQRQQQPKPGNGGFGVDWSKKHQNRKQDEKK